MGKGLAGLRTRTGAPFHWPVISHVKGDTIRRRTLLKLAGMGSLDGWRRPEERLMNKRGRGPKACSSPPAASERQKSFSNRLSQHSDLADKSRPADALSIRTDLEQKAPTSATSTPSAADRRSCLAACRRSGEKIIPPIQRFLRTCGSAGGRWGHRKPRWPPATRHLTADIGVGTDVILSDSCWSESSRNYIIIGSSSRPQTRIRRHLLGETHGIMQTTTSASGGACLRHPPS